MLAHVKGDDTEQGDNASAIIDEYTGDRNGLTVQAGGAAAVGDEVPPRSPRTSRWPRRSPCP